MTAAAETGTGVLATCRECGLRVSFLKGPPRNWDRGWIDGICPTCGIAAAQKEIKRLAGELDGRRTRIAKALMAWHGEGSGLREIANEFKVSEAAVRAIRTEQIRKGRMAELRANGKRKPSAEDTKTQVEAQARLRKEARLLPATTSLFAERTGLSRVTAYRRLRKLADAGLATVGVNPDQSPRRGKTELLYSPVAGDGDRPPA